MIKVFFLLGTSIPFVLLSWVYVLYFVGIVLYNVYENLSAPDKIKEYRWKLRHMNMSFNQIFIEMH
jgi:hypothetical protein